MPQPRPARRTPRITDPGIPLADVLDSWERRLRANGRSPRTVVDYRAGARALLNWLEAHERPTGVRTITRATIEAFQAELAASVSRRGTPTKPGTVANRHRSLKQLFRFLEEEGEIIASPMAAMPLPTVTEPLTPILAPAEITALLDATTGADFDARRDAAIVRVMLDAGTRAAETAGLTLPDVDLDAATLEVLGKGGRRRLVAVGDTTVATIDRYLRARRGHRWATKTDVLWLGTRGPLGTDGISAMLDRRAGLAGIGHVHPHQLRHTWARNMKAAGIQPDEFKSLGGWRSDTMPARYGRADVAARAVQTARRLSPLDQLARNPAKSRRSAQ